MKKANRGANGNTGSKWISKAARLAIYIRDGFTCLYCGRCLRNAPRNEITLDHLDPRSVITCPRARRNPRRLVTACVRCNSSRQDKPWREFAPGGAISRILKHVRRPLNLVLARSILRGEVPEIELQRWAAQS
jgi:ferredoxin